ncbi:amino acid ABC transporter permease [Sinorhizobium sp. GL28]|uniref:amino acid ABC transporter permease n=1 Tax=Sinorhizobium sp. GL28 TaxID=1358418 RepID=UPI00071DF21E|nr:amino acid ABC transporter permease [Sinorhizobium sp. GL28]KSV84176.1 hypothetical protein N184_12850 [Sinorhizobium sp. GL28]
MTEVADLQKGAKISNLNDPKVRAVFSQVAVVAILLFLVVAIIQNASSNLSRMNQDFGFAFLSKSAGFDIFQVLFPYSSASSYGTALIVGLFNTILISVLSIVAATVLGLLIGIMRLSRNWLASRFAVAYIEFFRNVPLLLQIFVWYTAVIIQMLPAPREAWSLFGLSYLSNRGLVVPHPSFGSGSWMGIAGIVAAITAIWSLRRWVAIRQARTGEPFPVAIVSVVVLILLPMVGFAIAGFPVNWDVPAKTTFSFSGGMVISPELMALFLALSIYMATYIAEAVRAGIQAVSHGQIEAAQALGLRGGATLRLIVLPQALRVIIPPLASIYLGTTKSSSLAVAIGYPDLVAVGGTVLNQTGKAIEIVVIWMAVYLALSLFTSLLMNWFNARMKLVER